MIAFDFAYYQPTSIKEAVTLFKELKANGKSVYYFSGGTEFISRARRNEITCDAVIDIKGIPETNMFEMKEDQLIIGASRTLTSLVSKRLFPLLSDVAKEIATQTERNKITIGGNIASNLPYKEAIMPFLVADSEVVVAGEKGTVKKPLHDLYKKGALLKNGEFIVQVITKRHWTTLPFIHLRRTKQSRINYPVVSLAAIQDEENTRVAISGLLDYPFRSPKMEAVFQTKDENMEKTIQDAFEYLPDSPISDQQATGEYRHFVLGSMLRELLSMKGAS